METASEFTQANSFYLSYSKPFMKQDQDEILILLSILLFLLNRRT